MSSSNMKTVILEQDPNVVLNFLCFTPEDGANPVLKESLSCRIFWHLFTQFSLSRTSSPSSPKVTSTADNLGAELFLWKLLKLSIIENTNWSSFINRSSSTKTSVFFPVSLTPIWNRQFGPPFAHQLVQGHCHLFKLEMMLIRKNLWISFC